jgi:outer membrane receptor protein involved in Fe transport
VLVNGRNSNLGNNLQRIPASSIDKIEIVNNPGAKYDADGEGGVINIVLKKDMRPGTNGAFAIGGGMGAKERFNSSLLLNHREGNVNFGLGYDNRFAKRTRQVFTDRETFAADEGHFLSQNRHDDRTEQTQNVKLNIDYGNTKNEFGFEGIFGYDQTRNYEPLYSRSFSKDGSFNYGSLRISDERQVERNWESNLNYNRKFANARRGLSANFSHSFGDEEENTNINSGAITEKGEAYGDQYLQITRNKELSNITTGRIDMAFPISSRATFETGYKGIWRQVNADFLTANKENEIYLSDPLYSNIFDFREHIHAVYGTYKSSFGVSKQWRYELGLRLEQWSNEGSSDQSDSSFTNSYLNFFPTANLSYKLKDGSQLRMNIGRRVNRPWLGQLNPFVDITDSLNRRGGNPALQPELVNTIELGWSKDWEPISINGAFFYRRGTNTILPYTTILPGGIAFTQPQNIGSSTTYGLEAFISTQGGKIWNSTASISLYNQSIVGNIDGDDIGNTLFSWYAKWANNFAIGKNLRAQILINYQAPTAITQGTRLAVYNMDLGAQQKIMQGRARIGMTITDVFNTLQNGSRVTTGDFTIKRTSKSDTRSIMFTFAMTFGSAFKEKLMENKFSAE